MRDLATKCLAEALATFLLVFIGAGAVVADAAFDIGGLLAVALANGLIWDAHWVYWTGPMIGAVTSGLLYHHVILSGRASLSTQGGSSRLV